MIINPRSPSPLHLISKCFFFMNWTPSLIATWIRPWWSCLSAFCINRKYGGQALRGERRGGGGLAGPVRIGLIGSRVDFSIFPLGSFFTIIVGMIEKKTVNQNNTFRFHDSPMFLSKDTAPQNLGNIYPFFVIINEKDEHAEFIYCMLNLAKQYAISIHVLLALLERDRIRKQYTNTHAVTCIPNCIPVCMCRFCVLCYGFGLSGAHASLLD